MNTQSVKPSQLIGSGDKIMLLTFPFVAVGLAVNALNPRFFSVKPFPVVWQTFFCIALIIGIILWLWSVYLIITQARKGKLIETGPFFLVKHPIYTSVALLVLPAWGLFYNSWLGIFVGAALYLARRMFAVEEEVKLAKMFGAKWKTYESKVLIPWL